MWYVRSFNQSTVAIYDLNGPELQKPASLSIQGSVLDLSASKDVTHAFPTYIVKRMTGKDLQKAGVELLIRPEFDWPHPNPRNSPEDKQTAILPPNDMAAGQTMLAVRQVDMSKL
jgi:hypothetical protein